MGKDPAFLFYSKDWISDTAEYEDSECRVLIDLMCYNHINGDLPIELERLSRLAKKSPEEFSSIWKKISHKFEPIGTPNGDRLVNRKLMEVIEERKKKSKKNKIIGIFASLIRSAKLPKKDVISIKKDFRVDDFTKYDSDEITVRLTEWFTVRLENGTESIGNENEDVIKNKYGEYKHVLLSKKEYNRLLKDFGEDALSEMIKTLDEGIQLKGYKYNDHNLALRKWKKKDSEYNKNIKSGMSSIYTPPPDYGKDPDA